MCLHYNVHITWFIRKMHIHVPVVDLYISTCNGQAPDRRGCWGCSPPWKLWSAPLHHPGGSWWEARTFFFFFFLLVSSAQHPQSKNRSQGPGNGVSVQLSVDWVRANFSQNNPALAIKCICQSHICYFWFKIGIEAWTLSETAKFSTIFNFWLFGKVKKKHV